MKKVSKIELMKIFLGSGEYEAGVRDCGGFPLSASDLVYIYFGLDFAADRAKQTSIKKSLNILVRDGVLESSKVKVHVYSKDGRNLSANVERFRVKGCGGTWFKKNDKFGTGKEITINEGV